MSIAASYKKARAKMREIMTRKVVEPSAFDEYADMKKIAEMYIENGSLLDRAYLIYYELHVDDMTFPVYKVLYAETKKIAEDEFAEIKSQHGEHYHLQIKGGPFKLTDHFYMMED